MPSEAVQRRLLRPVDKRRDHLRGGGGRGAGSVVLIYSGDYLCPYCQRLRFVLERLRKALGDRMAYVFRHFPNERVHPGAEFISLVAEAAGRQGKYWEMHDAIYQHESPVTSASAPGLARGLGLDMARFERDLKDPKLLHRVEEDLADGRRNGVTATPTIFIDGVRYDGAWDFYSMLEALERPVGARMQRTARAFANLPASAGIALLIAAGAALVCANSPLAGVYQSFVGAQLGIGPHGGGVWMSVGDWCSEGLLAFFFLILGLEIRREMTAGSLSQPRAAVAPVIAAVGGVLAPAAIYLALNPGPTAPGWSAPADTGVAFTLGVLALFGARASASLKVFVAAYAVVDDLLSVLILALFYPRDLHPAWLIAAGLAGAALFVLNRWRVYASWPYRVLAVGLWLALHFAGVSGALTGVVLAAFLPTRPTPAATPLLAQAATALAELEHAEKALRKAGDKRRLEQEPVWGWASRNLSAAAARLLSPAERIERGVAPWSTYVVLPLFAFTAAGVPLAVDLGAPNAARVLWGVILGLVVGKPLGIVASTWAATRLRLAIRPENTAWMAFVGAAALCGIGDPLSILIADQAFAGGPYGAVAKLGILAGSALAALVGAAALALSPSPATPTEPATAAA